MVWAHQNYPLDQVRLKVYNFFSFRSFFKFLSKKRVLKFIAFSEITV